MGIGSEFDRLYPLDPVFILQAALSDRKGGLGAGLGAALRFIPRSLDPFRLNFYGKTLETPLGVSAGPHTQMAQNILTAWQTGARFIELKTVQVLENVPISRPCINMRDEGYNCEWSQELGLDESYREYLHAYVLIHVLHKALAYPACDFGPGFIFNMSVGYDLAGIKSPGIQKFLDRMADASADIEALRLRLAPLYPAIADLAIDPCISDNLTVSTMHGCPAEEIERIGRYFLEERRLHTTIKLNPTLLGAEVTRNLLGRLGYHLEIPDDVFKDDLGYEQAMELIRNLRAVAQSAGKILTFKLTNTLPVQNSGVLPKNEKLVYLSGRALHPLSVALAEKLQADFAGELNLSFSGGVDVNTVADCLACGFRPVTVCSDLLRPNGYARMGAMLESLRDSRVSASVSPAGILQNLAAYAHRTMEPGGSFGKSARQIPVKVKRVLPQFDCAAAPCARICPTGQRQPDYLDLYADGQGLQSRVAMISGNPLHHMQAAYCDYLCKHRCESVCLRAHLDKPVRVQAVRALIQAEKPFSPPVLAEKRNVLVRGDGIAGLVCSYMLSRAGVKVMVETAGPDKHAAWDEAFGPAMVQALQADRAAMVHRDVFFTEQPVELVPPLPEGTIIYITHDALPEAIAAADAILQGQENGQESALIDGILYLRGLQATSAPASMPAAVQEGHAIARRILDAYGLPWISLPSRNAAKNARERSTANLDRGSEYIYTAKQARVEAARCLHCDTVCGICAEVCPNRANLCAPSPALFIPIPHLFEEKGVCKARIADILRCQQPFQVLHLADLCNHCGNCATFCPSSDAPFQVKTHLYISPVAFEAATYGYLVQSRDSMVFKDGDSQATIEECDSTIVYTDPDCSIVFQVESLDILEAKLTGPNKDITSVQAAEMLLVYLLSAELRRLVGNAK